MKETDFLVCPICKSRLEHSGKSLICVGDSPKRHCFDLSSSGYTDLSYRSGGGGDPKDAVNDRTAFLDKGYYLPLSECINRICKDFLKPDFFLIDAGCGEGYYSEKIAAEFDQAFVFGVDLSKHAAHRATVRRNLRSRSNSFYSVASVFQLPVADSVADCVLSMFAPVAQPEAERVLKPCGIMIIGAAGERHLYQLKEAIYDTVHLNDERADLPQGAKLLDKRTVTYMSHIDNAEDIRRLFGMTPYRFRTSESSLKLLNNLSRLDVEINVDFYVYQINA